MVDEVGQRLRCRCGWWIDTRHTDPRDAQWEAVTHECAAPWKGFARYTIRPDRPKGRRTD
jgi:hypothetical protein